MLRASLQKQKINTGTQYLLMKSDSARNKVQSWLNDQESICEDSCSMSKSQDAASSMPVRFILSRHCFGC